MFYSKDILSRKKGKLGLIWVAGFADSEKQSIMKISKREIINVDVGKSCKTILCPEEPFALRLSASLLVGVSRIYGKQISYLWDDSRNVWISVKKKAKKEDGSHLNMKNPKKSEPKITMEENDSLPLSDSKLLKTDSQFLDDFYSFEVGRGEEIDNEMHIAPRSSISLNLSSIPEQNHETPTFTDNFELDLQNLVPEMEGGFSPPLEQDVPDLGGFGEVPSRSHESQSFDGSQSASFGENLEFDVIPQSLDDVLKIEFNELAHKPKRPKYTKAKKKIKFDAMISLPGEVIRTNITDTGDIVKIELFRDENGDYVTVPRPIISTWKLTQTFVERAFKRPASDMVAYDIWKRHSNPEKYYKKSCPKALRRAVDQEDNEEDNDSDIEVRRYGSARMESPQNINDASMPWSPFVPGDSMRQGHNRAPSSFGGSIQLSPIKDNELNYGFDPEFGEQPQDDFGFSTTYSPSSKGSTFDVRGEIRKGRNSPSNSSDTSYDTVRDKESEAKEFYSYLEQKAIKGCDEISFFRLTRKCSRLEFCRLFSQVLVIANLQLAMIHQEQPFGDITISIN